MDTDDAVVVAEVDRSGLVESRHHGSVAGIGADGTLALRVGAVARPMYPRSANKPAQAVAMVRAGLPLDGELLALAAASHSGEDFHRDGVRAILAEAGLDESALRNTPRRPIDPDAADADVRAGRGSSALAADCSGKHAAMLLTCVVNGWPTDDYRDPAHPLQRLVRETVGELAGEPVAHTGVDGCGAPVFAMTLDGLARTFGAIASAEPGSAECRVAEAVRAHPEFVSGTTRDEVPLIRGVTGLVVKSGAEGVLAAGLADGRAVAVKIDDGGARARTVVLAAALERLGVDVSALDGLRSVPVPGGGEPVGAVRASAAWS
ncbi:asparaginase [Haloactinopolyspora alba]|uniref:Asparaginase n=2 Tax=Haloactinopolyspora alba TaxID=648780 RepID=A0A2P8DK06_9ACTN|nr:asparaginase [Haloactinopolyspora alba]